MANFVLFVLAVTTVVNCDDHFVPSILDDMLDASGEVSNNTVSVMDLGVRSAYPACPPGSCFNGGTCLGENNGIIYCRCPTGYSGGRCDVRACQPPCSINGYCNNGVCACNSGFLPPDCKARSNPCGSNPCPSGLRCFIDRQGRYYCRANDVCTTIRCPRETSCDPATGTCRQIPPPTPGPTVCLPNPCQNGCVCEPSCRHEDGYFCKSTTSAYTGKKCNIKMPRITCDRNRLVVMSSAQLLQQFGNPSGMQLVLGDQYQRGPVNPMCVLTNDGSSYSISAPVNQAVCGIRETKTTNGIEYRTTLWLRMIGNMQFDMPVPIAMFKCKYKPEFTVSTSLQPQIDIPQTINGEGKIATQGSISLCKKQNFCPNVCPAEYQVTGRAVYVVGEMLHLNIRTGTGNPQQKAAIEELFISCNDQPLSDRVVSLVTSGCPATSASNYMETEITFNAKTDCVCVSFRVPQLLNCNSDRVYIHAKLADCGSRIMTTCGNFGSSVQTCVPSVGRRRRATDDPLRIFGPLYFVDLADGEADVIMYPGKDIIPVDAVLPKDLKTSQTITPSIILSVAVIFLFCIFFACFVIYRKRFSL